MGLSLRGINKGKYVYLGASIFVSLLSFVKSYIYMKSLSKTDVGLVSLFQSVIILVSFLQLGVSFGGYRILSFSTSRLARVNNTVSLYLLCLTCVLLFVVSLLVGIGNYNEVLFVGVLGGIMSLLMSWNINLHIVKGRVLRLGILMIISSLTSMMFLPIVLNGRLEGVFYVILSQSLFFNLFTYIVNTDFRIKFKNLEQTRLIFNLTLRIGFIPFLCSIVHYLMLQLEKWIIGYDLGLESLGGYYLVFIYSAFFAIVPSALGTFNFPYLMKSFSGSYDKARSVVKQLKRYYIELLSYIFIVGILTYFVLPGLVNIVLPDYSNSVIYVKIIFWGLSFFTLIDPISFMINAQQDYSKLLIIYSVAAIFTSLIYLYVLGSGKGSLIYYSIVSLLFYLLVSVGYIIYYFSRGKYLMS